MKTNLYVEFNNKKTLDKDIVTAVKKAWTAEGNKINEIKTMDLYFKAEESAVYYVINETVNGKVEL